MSWGTSHVCPQNFLAIAWPFQLWDISETEDGLGADLLSPGQLPSLAGSSFSTQELRVWNPRIWTVQVSRPLLSCQQLAGHLLLKGMSQDHPFPASASPRRNAHPQVPGLLGKLARCDHLEPEAAHDCLLVPQPPPTDSLLSLLCLAAGWGLLVSKCCWGLAREGLSSSVLQLFALAPLPFSPGAEELAHEAV